MNSDRFDADIAIIGYGPTGVAAANALGSRGVRTIAFERDKDIYQRARAVTVNDWTLRCFQSVGLDEPLLANMDPHIEYRWRTYAGKELLRVKVQPSTLGQPTSTAIYQPVMEQTLRDGAARYAKHVNVRYGESVTGIAQDSDGVTLNAGSGSVRVRYVLACDGGSSATREQLGIKLLGDTIDTRWVVIDAKVKRWWPERHILTFWSDRRRPVVDIALGLGNHRWEFPLEPHESEQQFATKDQLWVLLNSMGITAEDVEIHQHAFYRHHVRAAERWRDGRVFLLGDAAHLMPPWAGQGMQSGIRDAFNLCWKLHLVVNGTIGGAAAEQLLDSYETERAPNVAFLTSESERLGRIIKMQMSGREKAEAATAALRSRLGLKSPPLPISQPPILEGGWLAGTPRPGCAIGRMPPQPVMGTALGRFGRLDDLIGDGFVLLGDNCDPTLLANPQDWVAWQALGARAVAVRSSDRCSEAESDIVDRDGILLAWMRKHGARAIALRPDRFVASESRFGLALPAKC